jgi:UDP-GlcNAc:undecaprenyl-phosphate GlcNAc-1-phosphate transferase
MLLFPGIAVVLSAAITACLIKLCRAKGWVVKPRTDRWHREPVAQFGGVAIIFSCLVLAVFAKPGHRLLGVILLTAAVSLLGLADDLFSWRPSTRLAVEFMLAAATVALGVVYPLRSNAWINICFTIIWIVGISNAFNLLDNMDGLAAGIAVIAGVILSLLTTDPQLKLVTLIFVGSVGGFLMFNFKPAKIFMGDTGSLAIGYYLACASILATEHISTMSSVLFVPVLVLFVPVFDTLLVSITRRLNGRAISAGARDHGSHRLVLLGMTERRAVLVLYFLAALSGGVSILWKRVWPELGWGAVGLFLFVATLFWLRLARLKLPKDYLSRTNVFILALPSVIHSVGDQAGAVFLDMGVIALSLYLSILLRFVHLTEVHLPQYLALCCLALVTKLPPLALFGVYRWRSAVSGRSVYILLKSAIVGSVAFVAAVALWSRFEHLSRAVFVIDLVLTVLLLAAVRSSDWFFDSVLHSHPKPRCILLDARPGRIAAYFDQHDTPYELTEIVPIDSENSWWRSQLMNSLGRRRVGAIYCGPECSTEIRSQVAELSQFYGVHCYEITLTVSRIASEPMSRTLRRASGASAGMAQ